MPTDIQHLGGKYSDGTVIGGKCLVQLCHLAPYAGELFHKGYPESHFCQVKGCLDTRNASAYYKDITVHFIFSFPVRLGYCLYSGRAKCPDGLCKILYNLCKPCSFSRGYPLQSDPLWLDAQEIN